MSILTEQLVNIDENTASQETLGAPIEKALGMNEESKIHSLLSSGLIREAFHKTSKAYWSSPN